MGRPRKNPLPVAKEHPQAPTDPVGATSKFKDLMKTEPSATPELGTEFILPTAHRYPELDPDWMKKSFFQQLCKDLLIEQIKAKGVALPDQAKNAHSAAMEMMKLIDETVGW